MLDYQDTFKIVSKNNLSGEDINILSRLYLPLIGIDSFSTYFLLQGLNEKETYMFKTILDYLNLLKSKELDQSLSKLEAVGLLNRYQAKDQSYAFAILSPLDGETFFKTPILAEYLSSQIGMVEYDKLKANYTKKSLRGLKDITKSFDTVYQTSLTNTSNLYATITNSKKVSNIKINDNDFDYVYFKLSCSGDVLSDEVLNDDNFRKNILEFSHLYHLSEDEMKEVIITTMNVDKELTYDYIGKNARNLYRKKSNNQNVKLETKQEDNFILSSLDDNDYKFIQMVETSSFSDILQGLANKMTPSVSELKIFEELKKNTGFSDGVINVMIIYVNNLTNGQLPGYNYFEKIANTWERANIKTSLDALNYTKAQKNYKNNAKTSYNKKEVSKPDWYDDYFNEVKNVKENNQDLSQEEIDKIFNEDNELFK